jgi:hypothetical protein
MAINNALNAPIPFAVGKGGTGATSLTDHAVLVGSGTSAVTALAAPTDGQLIIGSTGADPSVAALTAGSGISITNGAGTISIDATAGLAWNNETNDANTMAINNGYVINATNLCTMTIPATAAIGSVFAIAGYATNGWVLQANTGQTINFGDDQSSTAGSVTFTNRYDSITIVCTTADTDFAVIASQGNMTVA